MIEQGLAQRWIRSLGGREILVLSEAAGGGEAGGRAVLGGTSPLLWMPGF